MVTRAEAPPQLARLPAGLGAPLLAALVDAAVDGIVICDEQMRYVYANPRACQLMGYPLEQLVGRNFLMNFPERMHPAMTAAYAAQLQGRTGIWTGTLLRPDGTELDLHWSNMTFTDGGRRYGAAIFRDVTHLDAASRAAASLAAAAAAARSPDTTLAGLLQALADWGRANTRAVLVALDTVDDAYVIRGGSRSGAPPGYADVQVAVSSAGARIPHFDVWVTGRPVVLTNARPLLRADPLLRPLADCLDTAYDWQAAVYLRIGFRDDYLGGLAAYFPADVTVPTDEEITYLQALPDHAAIGVGHARLLASQARVAALEERSRLARELHDSVSQALFAAAMHARSAQKQLARLPDPPARLTGDVAALRELTANALAEMRALIFELRPDALAQEGLVAALTRQAAAVTARTGIEVEVTGPPARLPLPAATEEHLYRAAVEAVGNAVKHAHPSRVRVAVLDLGDSVEITVTDDGDGFDPTGEHPGHLGLHTMHERAAAVGAHLDLTTAPGAGTTVRLSLATAREQEAR